MYTKKELQELGQWCVKNNIWIISDEVYEKIAFSDNTNHVSIASLSSDIFKNTVTINGLSKSHCMTGWRVGYAAGPAKVISAMNDFQSQFLSHIPTFVQIASITALKDDSFIPIMVEEYKGRKDLIIKLIKEHMPLAEYVIPDGAFYIFPNIKKYFGKKTQNGKVIINANDFCEYILEEARVAIVPGDGFGSPNNVRFSLAVSPILITNGLQAIGRALNFLE